MQKHIFKVEEPFELENGQLINKLEIAYHTAGTLNSDKTNVVWVCHALTANSNVADWWAPLFGPNMLFDPEQDFIICANMLGSCYGTTGPASTDPATGRPYYFTFPEYTIRDIAAALDLLRKHLAISKIKLLTGGSMGGQVAMEWAIEQPDVFDNLVLMATSAVHSPWGIALNEAQRMAIEADGTWRSNTPEAGKNGLKAARAMALISYRNYQIFLASQSETNNNKLNHFKAASYQQYQGQKLADRFNAYCYYWLSKAMDTHNVGRGRGSVEKALSNIKALTLSIGIKSDMLFPTAELKYLAKFIPNATFVEFDSPYGHDGFLTETEKLMVCVKEFQRNSQTQII